MQHVDHEIQIWKSLLFLFVKDAFFLTLTDLSSTQSKQ